MDLIQKYYNKVQQLIKEASDEGIEIMSYCVQLGGEDIKIIDSGIMIGTNLLDSENSEGKYKKISTWK